MSEPMSRQPLGSLEMTGSVTADAPFRALVEQLQRMPAGSLVPASWVVAQLLSIGTTPQSPPAGHQAAAAGIGRAAPDRLLTVEETAERLGTTPGWVHQHWRQRLPFGQKLSHRVLRFSERALERHLATTRGAA